MRQIPKWLWWLGGSLTFLAVAAALLLHGNEWWLSGLATVSFLAWLAGVLAAFYASAERRPAIVGGVVASFLYLLLALGPWFGSSVGPWLLTTRAFSHIETKWLGREPQAIYQAMPVANYSGLGSNTIWTTATMPGSGFYPGYLPATSYVSVPTGPSTFVSMGHWLMGIAAAAIGAFAAGWISRRGRKAARCENPFAAPAQPPAAVGVAQQSPFAETAQQSPFAEAAK